MALHRSAHGKMIDMTALRNKNERVRAVGNMNVNARGDTIDSDNRIINDVSKRVNKLYARATEEVRTPRPPVENTAKSVSEFPEDYDSEYNARDHERK
jgi:hypothetical protein